MALLLSLFMKTLVLLDFIEIDRRDNTVLLTFSANRMVVLDISSINHIFDFRLLSV